ncbi:MAG: Methionyl-tRNA formyltransferase [Candidatus Woesebacteria bacterium GW2011_GWB1_38_5b]|uniref:Methionyl-tRNA formyltransferase n=1 Tax=Candidatus Woesebacteria bacterium GW2011_GWB1_38_5b TaxID=1618569 RepID=A0A0G0KJM9_9BACT|nr:MAG: Methionyl-tRNA formyltransferase [Candidatus Woesebacteria bacterium GW2011_GWB1_38_5b]
MAKAKVVFLGGKSLGYSILATLLKTERVLLIVTNPSDLDEIRWYPSLRELAKKHGVTYTTRAIHQLENKISKLQPDYIVCAYYDKILKKSTLDIPKVGCINIHMALSDEYQGCWPTTFPIIDGKDHAGVTIHSMISKVDAGDVYARAKVYVDSTETGKSLYIKCAEAGAFLFRKRWKNIKSGKLKPRKPVGKSIPVHHKRSDFPSHKISLSWRKDKIDKYVRALTFPPFPRPYFIYKGKKFEIDYRG